MAMTKRDFLLGAAAASGGVMLSRIDASGQVGRRVIDAHTHWDPAQWVDLVQNEGEAAGARIGRNDRGGITFNAGGIGAVFNPNYIDLESRIKSMDETGINAQVLSLMGPMVYWAPPALTVMPPRSLRPMRAPAASPSFWTRSTHWAGYQWVCASITRRPALAGCVDAAEHDPAARRRSADQELALGHRHGFRSRETFLFDFPLMLAAAHKRRGKPDPSGGGIDAMQRVHGRPRRFADVERSPGYPPAAARAATGGQRRSFAAVRLPCRLVGGEAVEQAVAAGALQIGLAAAPVRTA